MREQGRSVDADPVESLVRELVDGIAYDLDRHEVIHAASFDDLGQRSGEAEYVGQPAQVDILTEFLFPELIAVQRLSDPAFAARKVGIAFDPHFALKLYPAVAHRLFRLFVKVGVALFEPYPHLRLGLREDEVVVFLYVAQLICESSRDFTFGFAQRPQPCEVDMRVSYAVIFGLFVENGFFELRSEHGSCRRRALFFENLERLFESRVDLCGAGIGLVQLQHREVEIDIIVIILVYCLVEYAYVATAQSCDEVFEAQFAVEARIDVEFYLLFARRAIGDVHDLFADERVEYVAFADDLSDALKDDAVLVEDETFALELYAQYDVRAFCRLGNFARKTEPGAAELVCPFLHYVSGLESVFIEILESDRLVTFDHFGFEIRNFGVATTLDVEDIHDVRGSRESSFQKGFVHTHNFTSDVHADFRACILRVNYIIYYKRVSIDNREKLLTKPFKTCMKTSLMKGNIVRDPSKAESVRLRRHKAEGMSGRKPRPRQMSNRAISLDRVAKLFYTAYINKRRYSVKSSAREDRQRERSTAESLLLRTRVKCGR